MRIQESKKRDPFVKLHIEHTSMKKCLLLITLIILPTFAMAQYHNPSTCPGRIACGACYGTGLCYGYRCMTCGGTGVVDCYMCAAYRQGQQARQRDEMAIRNNANLLWSRLVRFLGNRQYTNAYSDATDLAERHDSSLGYLMVGWMNEMGIGTTKDRAYAKRCYKWGADLGSQQCKEELRRINNGRYLTSSDAVQFKDFWTQVVLDAYEASQSIDWNY